MANGRQGRLERIIRQPFAHRGLHGGKGLVENSASAFKAAIAIGHGIELDVQETADGQALVFHDYALERLTGRKGNVREHVSTDLNSFTLKDNGETLFTLDHFVREIAGETAVLVEVKSNSPSIGRLCQNVLDAIQGREMQIAIMSFNPEVCRWFAHHAPEVLRGLVITEKDETSFFARMKGGLKRIIALARSRPDFLAYDIDSIPAPLPDKLRAAGMPILTWTVRTTEQYEKARLYTDQVIHELPVGSLNAAPASSAQ